MKKERGQVSLEYAIIFMAVFFSLIVLGIFLYNYSDDAMSDVADIQLTHVCTEILDQAEEVYYEGEYSKRTIDITVPSNLHNISVEKYTGPDTCTECYELRFNKKGSLYNTSIYCSTSVNISGNFSNGSWTRGDKKVTILGAKDHAEIKIA